MLRVQTGFMEWLHIRVWETTRTHTYNLAWIGLEEKQLGGKEQQFHKTGGQRASWVPDCGGRTCNAFDFMFAQ
jgi:hypothetical protein